MTKSFGRHRVLRKVSLGVESGTILGLIGPNGSGKTTLLRILLDLIRPDTGDVRWRGLPPGAALRRYRATYFASGQTLPETARVGHWSALFELNSARARDRRRIRSLSRGQRQLLGLQVALAAPTYDFIVLDEPWEGLDPQGADWLVERLRTLRASGATALVSSHRLTELAGVCDTFALLHGGRLTVIEPGRFRNEVVSVADRLKTTFSMLASTAIRS